MTEQSGDWLTQLVAAARAEHFDLATLRSSARSRRKVLLCGKAKNRQPITIEISSLDKFTAEELQNPEVIAGLVDAVHRWCKRSHGPSGTTVIVNAIDVLARLGFEV